MRLKRLRIERYGCFAETDLIFATEPGRLNLMVAPNGAGKSLLRQAFHDVLFDIPLQSPMKFRFNYPGMALHAEAVAADGTTFGFGWARQGKPQRRTTDPVRFAALRAEIVPRQLEQLFALDTTRLRQGGTDLKGGETLAGALLSGTGELARPRKVMAEIEARRLLHWAPGKSRPPLNAALAALTDARKRVRAAVQRPLAREQQERELAALRTQLEAARADHHAALAETRRLHRIALTRAPLAALQEAEDWLASHHETPALPPGLEQPLAEARSGMVVAKARLSDAEAAVAAATHEAGQIERDEAAARHADALARLSGQFGAAEKAADDLVLRQAERAKTQDQVRHALRDIGAAVPLAAAAALVPDVALLSEARSAIRLHAGLRSTLDGEAERARQAARRLAEAELVPDAGAPVPDGLEALLAEIRADRNPVQHEAEMAGADLRAQAGLVATLARVPGWTAGAAALRDLAVPGDTGFERLDAEVAALTKAMRQRTETLERVAQQRDDTRQRLAALRETTLPDEAAIAAARAVRDQGWRLIHRRAFSAEPPDTIGEQDFCRDVPLPLAFERSIRAADDLADRRIAELDRVNEADRLTRELSRLDAAWQTASADVSAASDALAGGRQDWAGAVVPLGLPPDATMGEVRGLLAARLAAIAALEAADLARGTLAALRARHDAWAARLAALLTLGQPVAALPALLAQADARVTEAQAAGQRLLVWETERRSARMAHRSAVDSLAAAEQALANWQEGWGRLLDRLGRPPGEPPEATGTVLDRIITLDQHLHEAAGLTERIDGMRCVLDGFADGVKALAVALGESPAADPFATARALVARRDRATALASGWQQAQRSLAGQRKVLAAAQQALREAEAARDAVVAAAGAADLDDAALRIAASREHTRFAALRDSALAALREHGGGLMREALAADVAAVAAEDMPAARERAEAAATEAGQRAEQAAVAVSEGQAALDSGADATAALTAAADYEAASALYARLLDEQLVLQVAAAMLSRAMAAVEADTGNSGIARLSAMFAAVTDGAYGVVLDPEDGTTLHAIEHRFPNEPKKLDELSEGTRDQLYLALRMIALRDHAASAVPLPFIADDILQTFDDSRALSALRALLDLSEVVQVIVLTHHPHLAALAGSLGDAVHLQTLALGPVRQQLNRVAGSNGP